MAAPESKSRAATNPTPAAPQKNDPKRTGPVWQSQARAVSMASAYNGAMESAASVSSPTVAVLGEAVFDFAHIPSGAYDFSGHPGGSPLNVAVAAARQGQPTTALTQFSNDMFGTALLEHLTANGVDTSLSSRSNDPTALAFVSQDEAGNSHFQFVANGSADKRWNPQPRPTLPSSVRFMQISSLTLFEEPGASTAFDIVGSCTDRVAILFDPTYRPALIPSRERFLAVLDALLPSLTFLKPSDQDLEFLYPGVDPHEVCADWLARGVPAVILTLGPKGSVLLRRGREPVAAPSVPIQIIDTIGAGDTFTGTLFAQLIERTAEVGPDWRSLDDRSWREALRWANQAAAITCQRPGCDPPTRAEVATATS